MTADELKQFCKERNLTYKELAEKIGYGEGAIKNAVSTNNVSQPMSHAIDMFSKISELENELKDFTALKDILKNITK